MPSQNFIIKIGKNEGLALSPAEMLELYFFGIPMITQDGKQMSEHVMKTFIRAAQQEIEGYLNIKLTRQVFEERRDFQREEYRDWSFIRVSYPVAKALNVTGFVNNIQQVQYPQEWLSARETNDEAGYFRNIYLMPSGSSAAQYSGVTPHVGFYGVSHIPNYWKVRYVTGFEVVPLDILNVIGRLAAINLFHIMGDLILGAGIASQSIGIDGLSQSISSTSSATNAGYGARVQGYITDIKTSLPRLKAKYNGFEMISL